MLRVVVIAFVLIGVLLPAPQANAGRFTCKAAQNLARVAALDRDLVVVDPDDVKKECRFSVNGEPAGSPPRGLIAEAVTLLRVGTPSQSIAQGNVDWLAYLLLAASRTEKIDDEFRNLLLVHKDGLQGCLKALEANQPKETPQFSDGRNLFCRSIAGGGEFTFEGRYWVQVVSAVSYLAIGAARRDEASYLFVPFGLFRPQR